MLQPVKTTEPTRSGDAIAAVMQNVERAVKGKNHLIELALAAFLARGHVLFEDVPGVGKTTLSLALARSLGLSFRRVQCTADLLPSDVIGAVIFDQKSGLFEFRQGPVFANIVLVDEINRATPKTQSALLEAMGEATVSVDRQSHALPDPFWIVATQNPLDSQGTHALPENQLDRFLMRLSIGYPDAESERRVVLGGAALVRPERLEQVIDGVTLRALLAQAAEVRVDDTIADYVVQLCRLTREMPQFALGASTRAAVALVSACRGLALVRGRAFVIPDDVIQLWTHVMNHRVILKSGLQQTSRVAIDLALREALRAVRVPD